MDNFFNPKLRFWKTIRTVFSDWKNMRRQMQSESGQFEVKADQIIVHQYPFRPSVAFTQQVFTPEQIINIDVKAFPPTLRIGDELIFVPATEKNRLSVFAAANRIRLVERADLWGWLLEPFLDTAYTAEADEQLGTLLSAYGLTAEKVAAIRQEVEAGMLRYNFDEMRWNWTYLGASDVLCAMRVKYSPATFTDFYQRVMHIALLPDTRF